MAREGIDYDLGPAEHLGGGMYSSEVFWRKNEMIRLLDDPAWRESLKVAETPVEEQIIRVREGLSHNELRSFRRAFGFDI